MNIKTALKEKNKQVKKNSENFQKLSQYNSVEEGSKRPYDPRESLSSWIEGVESLIELKTKIHKANLKVYDKIFRLSELKSVVKQLKGLDCTEGKQRTYRSEEPQIKNSVISLLERDSLVSKYEAEIEALQEDLDTHNGKTKI